MGVLLCTDQYLLSSLHLLNLESKSIQFVGLRLESERCLFDSIELNVTEICSEAATFRLCCDGIINEIPLDNRSELREVRPELLLCSVWVEVSDVDPALEFVENLWLDLAAAFVDREVDIHDSAFYAVLLHG